MYDIDLIFSQSHDILNKARTVWIAYSGGVDSHVLMHSFLRFYHQNKFDFQVIAIHINHGIHEEADIWQEHVIQICKQLQVELVVETVIVEDNISSLEASARIARYGIFNKYVKEQDLLLTAHNQDDQAETLLFRILRGAGVKGLRAIPRVRKLLYGNILRPLLSVNRNDILEYARHNNLIWLEDHSNQDLSINRNYLRHKVFPLLKSRWPNYTKTFERAIKHSVEANLLLDDLAEIDIKHCQVSKDTININSLTTYSLIRQKNVIRYFINSLGFKLPSNRKLEQIISEVMHAKEGAKPCLIIDDYMVRRFNNNLYFINKSFEKDLVGCEIELNIGGSTELPKNTGVVISEFIKGEGLDVNKDTHLVIKFRIGGEKILSPSLKEHYSLKKMFNKWGVPPWERGHIPIVYHGDKIISVIGHYIRPDYLVSAKKLGLTLKIKQN